MNVVRKAHLVWVLATAVKKIEKFIREPLTILGVKMCSFNGLQSRHYIKVREPMVVSKYTDTMVS